MIIYKHIPKCAGNSIIKSLSDDIVVHGHSIRDKGYRHLYHEVRDNYDSFVFTFVRNPFDRVVSAFFYLNNFGNNFDDYMDYKNYISQYRDNFPEFIKRAFPAVMNQIHFMPQYKWIYFGNKSICNYIGRYESLNDDYNYIAKLLDIKVLPLDKHNTSDHMHYEKYYDEQLRDIIKYWYKKDFELFYPELL